MNARSAAGYMLVVQRDVPFGKISQRLLGALKIFSLFIVAILAMVTALPRFRIDLATANSDELLLKLSALGGEGAAVLCNPKKIENYLSIRIDERGVGAATVENFPVAISSINQLVSGSYWKFQADAGTVCRLQLQIAGRRFCDTDSPRVQRLIGRRVQIQLPIPGEAGSYDHGYELARNSKEWSVIGWRELSRSCPGNVEIAAISR